MDYRKPYLLRFPCLPDLEVKSCPNLTLMPSSPSLKRLEFVSSIAKSFEKFLINVVSESTSLSRLEELVLQDIEDMEFL